MSPVRVLVRYADQDELRIMKCMLNKKYGSTRLYIVETNMIVTTDDPDSPLDYRKIGYKITTRKNSTILNESQIYRAEDGTRYTVENLSGEYHTLGECLYAKLFDWCAKNRAAVLGII